MEARMHTIFLLLVTLALSSIGCAGTAAKARAEGMHEILNIVTDVADPLYGAAVSSCEMAETVASLRGDQSKIEKIRSGCDKVFAAFESLRDTQLAARAAIEAYLADSTGERLMKALSAVSAVRNAVEHARAIWQSEGPGDAPDSASMTSRLARLEVDLVTLHGDLQHRRRGAT